MGEKVVPCGYALECKATIRKRRVLPEKRKIYNYPIRPTRTEKRGKKSSHRTSVHSGGEPALKSFRPDTGGSGPKNWRYVHRGINPKTG